MTFCIGPILWCKVDGRRPNVLTKYGISYPKNSGWHVTCQMAFNQTYAYYASLLNKIFDPPPFLAITNPYCVTLLGYVLAHRCEEQIGKNCQGR